MCSSDLVLVRFNVLKEDYTPAAKAKVTLTLIKVSGESEEHVLETDQNGDGAFQFLPDREGFYSVEIELDRNGEKITDKISFGMLGETAEFDKPLVNADLLKNIAEITGGQYVVLDAAKDLSAIRFESPEVMVLTNKKTFSLWDNWWSYGLLVGFLVVDWWVRRKSGLS